MKAAALVFTRSYMAQARTAAQGLKKFHPDIKIYGLVVDETGTPPQTESGLMELIPLSALPRQETIRKMTFYYAPLELCCALRPFFHQYIYEKTEAERWIYLDTDILVLDSLEDIFHELETASICLTTHYNKPQQGGIHQGSGIYYEKGSLQHGIYNGGMLGVRRSREALRFIEWFCDRLTWYAFQDFRDGLYLDQLWLNYVPVFFEGARVLKDDRMNVAYWNLAERRLELAGEKIIVNGRPLAFFHFSGWSAQKPGRVSSLAPWCDLSDNEAWRALSVIYLEKLKQNGLEEFSKMSCPFNFFSDGRPVLPEMRKEYYKMLLENTWSSGSPFENSRFFYGRFCRRPVRVRKFFKILTGGLKDAFAVFGKRR